MRKLFLFILSFVLSQLSTANYLENWPNDALCSWMENPSPPSYMVEEVKTRDLTCSGGIVINPPPEIPLPPLEESVPDPINIRINEEIWLEKYGLIADDLERVVNENGSSMVAIYDDVGNLLNRTELIQELIAINPYFEPLPKIPPPIEEVPVPLPPDPKPLPIPEPPTPKDDRPGWKIQEGSNFWSVDATDPYWQTEEGSKKAKAAKERGSWIEQEANRYTKENPGVDPPTGSYYATDPCGEGKQPANASC